MVLGVRLCEPCGRKTAVKVHWDAIKEADIKKCSTIVELKPRLWNKDCEHAWRYVTPWVCIGVVD